MKNYSLFVEKQDISNRRRREVEQNRGYSLDQGHFLIIFQSIQFSLEIIYIEKKFHNEGCQSNNMAVSLIVVLGILTLIGSVIGGGASQVVNIYSMKTYNERLGLALFLSSTLTLCCSFVALAAMFLSPFSLLLPYIGPPTIICTILFSIAITRKEDRAVE